jgi:hypothetical protein
MASHEHHQPSHRQKRFWGIAFLTAFVGLLAFGAHSALSQSVSGSVDATNIQQKRAVVTFNSKPVTVQTDYASFQYPAALMPLPNVSAVSPVLASRSYSYGDIENWRMSINVTQINGQTIDSDSGYQLRATQSDRYAQSDAIYGNQDFTVMTDTQAAGFSKVAYLAHGNQVAEISLYGDDAQSLQTLQATFATVLGSWQWTK